MARLDHRNRTIVALLSAMAAVLAVAVVIIVISAGGSPSSAGGSSSSWTQPTAISIPGKSRLIPYRSTDVVSPIIIGGDAPMMSSLDWTSTRDSLVVRWGVQGIIQSATTSSDKPPGPAPTVASAGHGYVIDALPRSGTSNTRMTVGGHPAVLSSGSPATDSGILADRWISWQLHDGRYVHGWSAAQGGGDLVTFASRLSERDQVLPRRITLGVTLPGLTAELVHHSGDSGAPNLDGLTLCPTTQSPQDQSEGASERCININISHGNEIDRAVATMATGGQYITMNGLMIYAAGNKAYARVDNEDGSFGINVWSPDRTPDDLALIAASVRFDPTMAAAG
jgi:hypothetical protein